MKRIALHLVAMSQLASCAVTWERAARVTQAVALTGLVCDGGETRQFLTESRWGETNPVLGPHPSSAALWLYLGAIGAAMLGADYFTGHKAGLVAAAAIAGIEIWSVHVNMTYGTSLCGIGEAGPWKPLPNGESGAALERKP